MSVPVLLAVDEDQRLLGDVERELVDRYARGYRVVCVSSAEEATAELEALAAAGEDVALVLAAQELGEITGPELLKPLMAAGSPIASWPLFTVIVCEPLIHLPAISVVPVEL